MEELNTQAQETVSTVETAPETAQTESTAPAPQQNERVFTQAQVEQMIKDRFKKYGDYDQLREIVTGLEALGYDRAAIKAQIEQIKAQQQQETFQKAGITDPEALREALLSVPEFQQMFQAQREAQERAQWAELATAHPWASEEHVNNPTFAALMKRGYSPLHAFRALYAEEIAKHALHSGEQAALANVSGRNQKQVPSGDVPGATHKNSPADMTLEEIDALGDHVLSGGSFRFR